MLDLESIKIRVAEATAGPWLIESEDSVEGCFIARMSNLYIVPEHQHLAERENDAKLICSAPTDLVNLISEVEMLRSENDKLKKMLDISEVRLKQALKYWPEEKRF